MGYTNSGVVAHHLELFAGAVTEAMYIDEVTEGLVESDC